MNTFVYIENHHVNALFSFHTENLLYQKSDFRAIGEVFICPYLTDFPNRLKYHGQDFLQFLQRHVSIQKSPQIVMLVFEEQKDGTFQLQVHSQFLLKSYR